VAEALSDPSRDITEVFDEMLETKHKNGEPHPVIAACAREMKNKADNERSGVLSTAMSFLTLYRDPIVAQNTSRSEFTIKSLMNLERPVSLYLVVPPSDKDRLKPLVRLLINQIVRKLTEEMSFKDGTSVQHYTHRLLLMIDEFPSLGKLDIFQEALAFIAGYGLKAYLITQDLSQLYAAYGKDESILSNCHVRIAYAPNKIETAELLSKMVGTTTIVKKSISKSGKRYGVALDNVSESNQEVQRPLLTPDECMRLAGPKKNAQGQITEAGDMLIFTAGFAPIYGKQILYFKDEVFAARARVEAPVASERVSDDDIKALKAAEAAARNTPEAIAEAPVAAPAQTPLEDEPQAPRETATDSPTQPEVETAPAPDEAAAGA
jgi:type IV secretion system protein VirD4